MPSSIGSRAALDEPVGVEQEQRAGREVRGRGGRPAIRRSRCRAATRSPRSRNVISPSGATSTRRRVARGDVADLLPGRVERSRTRRSRTWRRGRGGRSGRGSGPRRPRPRPAATVMPSAARSWPMVVAAGSPRPTTSPTATASRPSSRSTASYQSPPISIDASAAWYRARTSASVLRTSSAQQPELQRLGDRPLELDELEPLDRPRGDRGDLVQHRRRAAVRARAAATSRWRSAPRTAPCARGAEGRRGGPGSCPRRSRAPRRDTRPCCGRRRSAEHLGRPC